VPKDGIVLKDGLLSFIVLPKGEEEKKWIEEFKRQRDGK
jgi:small subunit ribosomal protein S7e